MILESLPKPVDDNLGDSKFLGYFQLVQFPSATANGGVDWWSSRAVHALGAAITNALQPGAFMWFEKTQGRLIKELPLPVWRQMKQMSVRMHFLRCDGLLNDWSVEAIVGLVLV
ncbi:e3 ubiquitin-protein ligase RNF13 [Trichonephila clavipes]|nr:e3 ubiquitin-protein ligase RNF13 [Trichonephila clavipes]